MLDAVGQALRIATPHIWNIDQGSQFTSPHYTRFLEGAGVRISMEGKGQAYDNIFTERFWRSPRMRRCTSTTAAHARRVRESLTLSSSTTASVRTKPSTIAVPLSCINAKRMGTTNPGLWDDMYFVKVLGGAHTET